MAMGSIALRMRYSGSKKKTFSDIGDIRDMSHLQTRTENDG